MYVCMCTIQTWRLHSFRISLLYFASVSGLIKEYLSKKSTSSIHTYIHTYVNTFILFSIISCCRGGLYSYTCMYVCKNVCMIVCTVCIYVCMYVCMYARMYVWLYLGVLPRCSRAAWWRGQCSRTPATHWWTCAHRNNAPFCIIERIMKYLILQHKVFACM